MKRKNILLIVLTIVLFSATAEAQTKPTTKSKTSTTKTTKPKAAPKAVNVYVCDDGKDKIYHKYSSCKMLNKCATEIKNIKDPAILKKQRRKACSRCFSKQV